MKNCCLRIGADPVARKWTTIFVGAEGVVGEGSSIERMKFWLKDITLLPLQLSQVVVQSGGGRGGPGVQRPGGVGTWIREQLAPGEDETNNQNSINLRKMVASAVFVLDLKGKTLISRNYRGDLPVRTKNTHKIVRLTPKKMSSIDKFMPLLVQAEENEETVGPVVTSDDGVHFLYVKHSNVYLVATTKRNSNATMIFYFLHKLVKVFTDYFKELEEESIRDNFVVIYELLDEMMDFGYPQTTEPSILKEYVLGFWKGRLTLVKVHYTGIVQIGHFGCTTTSSSHERSVLEK